MLSECDRCDMAIILYETSSNLQDRRVSRTLEGSCSHEIIMRNIVGALTTYLEIQIS